MKFDNPIPVEEIASRIQARILGDPKRMATGINEIHKVVPGDITFVDVQKYFDSALRSVASIVILNEDVDVPEGKTLLFHDEPFKAYNDLVSEFRPFLPLTAQVSPLAKIHPTAIIEPNVVIGPYTEIGAHSHIQAGAVIHSHCIIGSHTIIQSGAIIGTDAFYYKRYPEHLTQWNTCGRVVIGDHVMIGAGCTLNKGVSGDTVVGDGTKFDSQIHIGHDAVIGKHCLFAAQVGIGGNTIIEDHVVLYGQVGVAQNIRIGAKAVVLAKSGVAKTIRGGKTYFGYPAGEANEKMRELASLRNLPSMLKR